MSDQNNDNTARGPVDEFAADIPIEGEVVEQISQQISSKGNGMMSIPDTLSLLPLRDTVVFPVLVAPIAVGRENSIKLVDDAVAEGSRILAVVAMKDASIETPTAKDIYPIGVAVVVRVMAKVPDGIRMIVQGVARIQIQQIVSEEPYLRARIKVIESQPQVSP
jgi:ATP-dependent Lon protease